MKPTFFLPLVAIVVIGCSDAAKSSSDAASPDVRVHDARPSDVRGDLRLFDGSSGAIACPTVTPTQPPTSLGLDPFYQRYVDSGGIPIIGSAKVPAEAFAKAHYVIANMLGGRPCLRKALALSGLRIGIMARDEVTTDLPEYSDLNTAFPNTNWDTRGRGFGATLVRPLTSGAVDNLLQDSTDPWFGELILLHEFAHTIFEFGVFYLQGGDAQQTALDGLYSAALAQGLWANTYAGSAAREYWAEGVQDFFDDNIEASPPNGIHNHVNTRAELEAYDPKLAAFIAAIFKGASGKSWPVHCTVGGGAPFVDPTPAAPLAASCSFDRGFAKNLGCGSGAPATSTSGGAATGITFVNRRFSGALLVEWLDTQGQAQSYGTVVARGQKTLSSFTGHVWRLRDQASGSCLGVFRTDYPLANAFVIEQ